MMEPKKANNAGSHGERPSKRSAKVTNNGREKERDSLAIAKRLARSSKRAGEQAAVPPPSEGTIALLEGQNRSKCQVRAREDVISGD